MKTAVVFYSKDGSTKIAAGIIAQKLGADVFELEEVKKRGKSFFSLVAAGFSGATGKKSALVNTFAQEIKEYEMICIGSPIWAGNPAAAVNSFVDTVDASGKDAIVFSMQADSDPYESGAKCADTIKTALENNGAKVVNIIKLYNAKSKNDSKDEIQKQISQKLK